jgi:hypothetical protein
MGSAQPWGVHRFAWLLEAISKSSKRAKFIFTGYDAAGLIVPSVKVSQAHKSKRGLLRIGSACGHDTRGEFPFIAGYLICAFANRNLRDRAGIKFHQTQAAS